MLAAAFFIAAGRETLFRIDAVSDIVTFIISGDTEWGTAPIRGREDDERLCETGGIKPPIGTAVEARRLEDGISIALTAPSDRQPIIVRCSVDDNRPVSFVELWFAQPKVPSVNDRRLLTGKIFLEGLKALKEVDSPMAAVDVTGQSLRVGGEVEPNSPVTRAPLLRSGVLSSETASWPINSSSIVVDRTLQPGEIVSFAQAALNTQKDANPVSSTSPVFTGILLIEDNRLRLIARTEAGRALVTSPNARSGKPAIVAPTMFARLQAQAEWGVFLLIGGLMLSILSALRALVMEEEKMFGWVGKPRGESQTGGSAAAAITLVCMGLAYPRPTLAQAVDNHPVFRIEVQGRGFGQGFAVRNPRGKPECLIVTAAHVAKPGDDIKLVGEQPNSGGGQAVPIESTAKFIDTIAPELVVLEPDPTAKIGPCSPMPQLTRSDALFETDGFGRLTYAEATGERRTIKVVVDGDPRSPNRLLATGLTTSQISPGISGSPLSINGKILAVANAVNNGVAELIRLDTATINPRYLAAAQVAAPRWSPAFDFSTLSSEYKDVATTARNTNREAVRVSTVARENEQRATKAAQAARDGLVGYGSVVLVETDRVFEGKIDADNVPNGWGVLRFTDGQHIGDEVRGLFRRDGTKFNLSGAGVLTYADTSRHGNKNRMEIGMSPNANGPGMAYFEDGSIVWGRWVNGENNFVQTYKSGLDKTGFEVALKQSKFDGPGIHWTVAGEPLCICVWKDGVVVKDETKKFVSARQQAGSD